MSKALEKNTSLKSLTLYPNVKEIETVFKILEKNTFLETLEFNELSGERAPMYAGFQKDNLSFSGVSLAWNICDDEPMSLLSNSIKTSSSITELDFSGCMNEFEETGIIDLANSLKTNSSIISLDFDIILEEEQLKVLADAIKVNKFITFFRFENAYQDRDLVNKVYSYVENNENFFKAAVSFVVRKFTDKECYDLAKEIKYLKYYQKVNKNVIANSLSTKIKDIKNIESKKHLLNEKAIQKYIAKNFFALTMISKNLNLKKNKKDTYLKNDEEKISFKLTNDDSKKRKNLNKYPISNKKTKLYNEWQKLINKENKEGVLTNITKYLSIWDIKMFNSKGFYELLAKVKNITDKFPKNSKEYQKFVEAYGNQNKSLSVLAKKLAEIKNENLTKTVINYLNDNELKILGVNSDKDGVDLSFLNSS